MFFIKPLSGVLPAALTLSLSLFSAQSQANEFADDFSSDSIRFSVGSFTDSSELYSVIPASNGLSLSTSALDGNAAGSATINLINYSDSIGMDFTHLSSSSASSGAFVNAFLEKALYSDNPNSSDQNREGTVTAVIKFGYDPSESPGAFYCLSREDGNGNSAELPNACGEFEKTNFAMDQITELDIALDRAAGQVIFTANGVSEVINIGIETFSPAYQFNRIQLFSDGAAATAEAILHAVRIGEDSIDLSSNPPIIDRYSTNFEPGTTVALENEKVAITAVSTADEDRWVDVELDLREPTDHLEAELTLASASVVSGTDDRLWASIQSNLYNTEADGGVDRRLGDVTAEIIMEARGDGLRRIELCFFRRGDADGDARTGLLNPEDPDNRCDTLPMVLEFDTPYRVSVSIDRNTSEFVARVNGYTRRVPISSEIFTPGEPFARVAIASRNGGISIGTIDNIRTSATALTATELNTGVTAPAPFPDAFEIVAVDSTIEHLFDFSDTETQLDFIDDFSGISSDFGFWSGRDRGGSGVSWNGQAVVFETNSAVDNDDGNWTEFYLDPKTNSIEASVSLSSDTRLPADGEAEIAIRAIFYNDTQDFGFNEQEGDFQAALKLEIEGNGRRRIQAQLRRRDSGGSSGGDLLYDVPAFKEGINSTIPVLDQQYKLSLSIDRAAGVMRFGLDDEFTDFQIPTGVFLPSQQRALISLNHNGSSGVAIGSIHAVKTDTIDEDFSLAAPLIAPYRPSFDAQRPGRSVEAVDGRLRLEADGSLTSGRDPRIVALNGSDFVGATIELSSESVLQNDGRVLVGVSGTLYNDLANGPTEDTGSEGDVFAAVRLTAQGNGEMYVQTCAWRSNSNDFSDATDLLSGSTEDCSRLPGVIPQFDTAYPAFIKLDRDAATLTFGFDGETVVHNITTDINNTRPFHGVRARTSDNSKVVAWADDLAFSENPVPLADSMNLLATDTSDTGNGGSNTGTSDSGDNGGSSGGGTVNLTWLLLALLLPALTRRRSTVLSA